MCYLQRCFAVVILAVVNMAMPASLYAGQAEYDDCILKYLKNAKHDVATRFIKQACKENYKTPTFTSVKRKAYNNCLLEHLVGVESLDAVMEISGACNRKFK